MAASDCFACRGVFQTPIIRESPLWRVVVNRNQDLLGKVMIVLRRHEEHVAGLTEAEWAELLGEVQVMADRLRDTFKPDHLNYSFLMNMDRHLHLHVIPRYIEDREVEGFLFSDPEYPAAYQVPATADQIAPPVVIAAISEILR